MAAPDSPPDPPNVRPMPAAEARRRYFAYVAVRFAGLALLFAGVWLGRTGTNVPSVVFTLLGGLTLFVRPRHLGLTR